MKNSLPGPRSPRYLREFARWFRKNHERFNIPLKFKKVCRNRWTLAFENYPKELRIYLSQFDLSVCVEWEEELIDCLQSFDVHPVKGRNGTVECKLCMPRTSYSSMSALLDDNLYVPFLHWVNDDLYPARKLWIYRFGDSTWAHLVKSETMHTDAECLQGCIELNRSPQFTPMANERF